MRDLEAVIEEKVRQDGPIGFDELVSAAQTTPEAAEEAIQNLQSEERVAYFGREKAYIALGSKCLVCRRSVPEGSGWTVRISGPDVADADAPEKEYTLHSSCYEGVFGGWVRDGLDNRD
jgi:hypothetical protein